MSNLDISKLPPWAKVELTKEDLMAFANKLMSSKVNENNSQQSLPENVLMEDAKEILQCSSSTVHRWVNEGKLRCYKVNRRNYYKRSELLALIEGGLQKPTASEEEEIMNHIRKNNKR